MSSSVHQLLGEEGPFASSFPGFSARDQQQDMASAVLRCIESMDVLVCEAGTGTGKTLAYLCAALLGGRKTIISTGTKNLQEQLFGRDLPAARKALGSTAKTSLLKGRANYLCHYRLEIARRDPPRERTEQAELVHIARWAGRTLKGDRAECTEVPETSRLWPRVTSTTENCVGSECPHYEKCHVLLARREAMEADIVVVNHHLFFADLALREEGFGEVLPGAEAVIFDEAHQLPDIATRFFGLSLGSTQLRELIRDTGAAYQSEAGDMPQFDTVIALLGQAVERFVASLGSQDRRSAWAVLASDERVSSALLELTDALIDLCEALELLAERGKGLESSLRRARDFAARLATLSETKDIEHVRWIETHPRGFTWHLSPLEVARIFSAHLYSQHRAWVFTSATLSINGSVEHFAERLGLDEYQSEIWESPFDYRHQALCYVPEGLPAPSDKAYTDFVVDAALPLLEASGGRAFLLFTSHAALRKASERVASRTNFKLFIQGSLPRDELLRQFRSTKGSVLLGTSSFWEGVDVRGDALVCVVIDKLPFAAPGDPVLEARLRALSEQGREPFRAYQLPQAIIALKQGSGRLIRDEADCGLLVLCDPRLYTRGYGKMFFNSLPPIPVTRSLKEAVSFLGQV